MTDQELLAVRDEVGAGPPEAEIEDDFERLGTVGAVVYAITSRQLAALIADPASFTVSGEYSQDVRANIESLERRLQRWSAFAPGSDAVGGPTRIVTPSRRRGR